MVFCMQNEIGAFLHSFFLNTKFTTFDFTLAEKFLVSTSLRRGRKVSNDCIAVG